jgi:hypothetical protein
MLLVCKLTYGLIRAPCQYPVTAYVGCGREISWDGPGDTERLKKEALRAVELKPILFFQSPER